MGFVTRFVIETAQSRSLNRYRIWICWVYLHHPAKTIRLFRRVRRIEPLVCFVPNIGFGISDVVAFVGRLLTSSLLTAKVIQDVLFAGKDGHRASYHQSNCVPFLSRGYPKDLLVFAVSNVPAHGPDIRIGVSKVILRLNLESRLTLHAPASDC